jgi:sorbitol/mannitol transport system substrate-binding protein
MKTSSRATAASAVIIGFSLVLAGLTACAASGQGGAVTLNVATVNNSQMVQMEKLTAQVFEKDNPNIKVNFVTLDENTLRDKVTQDVATNSGKFDIATVGSYETPIWAHNGWIEDLTPYFSRMSSSDAATYKFDDLLKPVMQTLSYKNDTYGLPFYGESSFLMYNKQIFAAHNLTMPDHPTWDQVATLAQQLNDPASGVIGIAMRGQAGWGMNLAPLDTVINTYGGSWFDTNWTPQLSSPASVKAVSFYVNLLQKYGEPEAANADWQACLNLMSQGKAAMFYDATSFGGILETPATSKVAGQVGYAYAPTEVTPNGSRWLWAWALDMIKSSKNKDAAFKFLTWATSKAYIGLVAKDQGWGNVPPGTRASTFNNPNYRKAAPYWQIVLNSMQTADPTDATLHKVPYVGVQFVGIPEFQAIGTQVTQNLSAAISGSTTVEAALQLSQTQTERIMRQSGYLK